MLMMWGCMAKNIITTSMLPLSITVLPVAQFKLDVGVCVQQQLHKRIEDHHLDGLQALEGAASERNLQQEEDSGDLGGCLKGA